MRGIYSFEVNMAYFMEANGLRPDWTAEEGESPRANYSPRVSDIPQSAFDSMPKRIRGMSGAIMLTEAEARSAHRFFSRLTVPRSKYLTVRELAEMAYAEMLLEAEALAAAREELALELAKAQRQEDGRIRQRIYFSLSQQKEHSCTEPTGI